MSRRRLARDDVQPMTDQDIDEWLQLLERLPQEDRDELKAEFSARARGEDPGNGSDPDLTGSDRRRARDRRVARDQPPAFAGRPTPGGTAVGIWDPARDQRQRRPAAALDAAPKLPTTEEIWPNALKNRVG
jgi:hypothetical protein